ncbi:MAG: hypothetical protein AABZ19_08260 [Pseudomonadota bacterium]
MRLHITLGVLLLAPAITHAMGDVCGLLTDRQWAELGLKDARKSTVPAPQTKDRFNTHSDLKGTACHVVREGVQTTLKRGELKSKEELDLIVFAPATHPGDESRIAATLDDERRKLQSEVSPKEVSHLPLTQGYCMAFAINAMEWTAAFCVGLRQGGVLIVSAPEPYMPGGPFLPMKTKALFEVVERKLAQDAASPNP